MTVAMIVVAGGWGCTSLPSPAPSPVTSSVPPSAAPVAKHPTPSPAQIAEANRLRQQGLQFREQGEYAAAIAALEQSTQLDPTQLSGYVILGWTLHLDQQPLKARQVLKSALRQDPHHVPALNALGIVYLVHGQLRAAVATHQLAAQIQLDNEIAHYNLSLAYHRLQRYDAAIAHAQTATQLEPENPHPWVALAIAHGAKQNAELAQQAYQRAINLDHRYRDSDFLNHLEQAGFSPAQLLATQTLRQRTSPN